MFQFIEAFAGKSQKLSISKDQLAGYTQTVTAYQLVNVMHTILDGRMRPVYLIDTPGFSDSKISEIEVVNMVRKWAEGNRYAISSHLDWATELICSNSSYYCMRILYFTPITETRLPGSRHRTFNMLKKLLDDYSGFCSLIVITTMWDTVHSERTRNRAESNFAQLKDETLKVIVEIFMLSFLYYLLTLYRSSLLVQALMSSNL